jgi:regulator of nucleoside diphosphate kinase
MRFSELKISRQDYARLMVLPAAGVLADELSRATVISEERMPDNVVRMHSRVTYVEEGSGLRREVELVYPDEADLSSGKVSVLAPVGAALLGLAEGESIEWRFPRGERRRLRVERSLPPAAEPLEDALDR